MPWITDFSGSSIEDGWRDFTKTKFRMNKGKLSVSILDERINAKNWGFTQ